MNQMNSVLGLSAWGRHVAKKLMKPKQKKKYEVTTNRWNIVKNDKVRVIQGPSAGEEGIVTAVLRPKNRVIVEGCNMRRRTVAPQMDGTPGKMVVRACSIHYSNVMLVDPSNGEPTKVSRRYLEDGTKVRVSKKTGTIIPKPEPTDRRPRSNVIGEKDTTESDVFAVTFDDYEMFLPHIYFDERAKLEEGEGGDP